MFVRREYPSQPLAFLELRLYDVAVAALVVVQPLGRVGRCGYGRASAERYRALCRFHPCEHGCGLVECVCAFALAYIYICGILAEGDCLFVACGAEAALEMAFVVDRGAEGVYGAAAVPSYAVFSSKCPSGCIERSVRRYVKRHWARSVNIKWFSTASRSDALREAIFTGDHISLIA